MTPKICDHLDACSECYARIKKAMDIVQEQAEDDYPKCPYCGDRQCDCDTL